MFLGDGLERYPSGFKKRLCTVRVPRSDCRRFPFELMPRVGEDDSIVLY